MFSDIGVKFEVRGLVASKIRPLEKKKEKKNPIKRGFFFFCGLGGGTLFSFFLLLLLLLLLLFLFFQHLSHFWRFLRGWVAVEVF